CRTPQDLLTPDPLTLPGEQRTHFCPQSELRVMRIGMLQVLDGADRFGPLGVACQLIERRRTSLGRMDGGCEKDHEQCGPEETWPEEISMRGHAVLLCWAYLP